MSKNEIVKFRSKNIKQILEALDEMRVGGVNESEVGREAMERLIPEILSDEEKMEFYKMYQRGEISEEVIRVAIGDDEFEDLQRMAEDTKELADKDISC